MRTPDGGLKSSQPADAYIDLMDLLESSL
jgi:hypothetical protein